MVIDTSAIIAILEFEEDWVELQRRLLAADRRLMSAATHLELSFVVTRGEIPGDMVKLDDFLMAAGIEIVPFSHEDSMAAREGFLQFGKGHGNRAKLNLGDFFAYGLAKRLGQSLLFKGDDFGWTDVLKA